MRRGTLAFGAMMALGLAACSSGEVIVIAELQVSDPDSGEMQARALEDLEIQLVPFDRDAVFDSLTSAASTPEPDIPAEVLEAQDSIAAAQARWQALGARWGSLRERMTTINREIGQYSPAENRYRQLFSEFADVEAEYNRIERQQERAFTYFDSLQQANLERANEVRIQLDNWADDAFADVDVVFLAKEREAGRETLADTTGVMGTTDNFIGLRGGTWWVHARYELPFSELYWNIPVDVVPGEPIEVRLTEENAEERPKL